MKLQLLGQRAGEIPAPLSPVLVAERGRGIEGLRYQLWTPAGCRVGTLR
jgi:hypothetical protein